jgi:uncharacterized membrane protein YtjA (UPF0391 family)
MSKGAVTFFLFSIAAVLLVYTGVLPGAATIAKLLFLVSILSFIACLGHGMIGDRNGESRGDAG